MATDKPRFSITMDEHTLNRVNSYKKAHHISTQSKAIVELVRLGLADFEGVSSLQAENSENLKSIQQAYYTLNDKGKDLLLLQAKLLTADKDYVTSPPSKSKTG